MADECSDDESNISSDECSDDDGEAETLPIIQNPYQKPTFTSTLDGKSTPMTTTTNLILLGPTGVGKSAASNLICAELKGKDYQRIFAESEKGESCTGLPEGRLIHDFRIADTPGLLDSKGAEKDEKNIKQIVSYSKSIGHINGIVILVNYRDPRFNIGILNTIKLYLETFGPQMLTRMGILYTRFQFDEENIRKLNELTNGYRIQINNHCKCSIKELPFWYVDCHPENLSKDEVPPRRIAKIRDESHRNIHNMLDWAARLENFKTGDIGKNIIKTEYETRISSFEFPEPVTVYQQRKDRYAKRAPKGKSSKRKSSKRKSTSKKKNGKKKGKRTPTYHNELVVTGWKTIRKKREERAKKNTHANGEISIGDWEIVKEWTE